MTGAKDRFNGIFHRLSLIKSFLSLSSLSLLVVITFFPYQSQQKYTDNQKSYTEESRVTYEIEPMGELVKLTLIHDQFGGDTETYQSTSGGWPMILNSLKTLLESGKPLNFPSSS